MPQTPPMAKLTRSLLVMADALTIATRRAGDAATAAHDVDGLIEQQLMTIYLKLAASCDALNELLDELQDPTTGQ